MCRVTFDKFSTDCTEFLCGEYCCIGILKVSARSLRQRRRRILRSCEASKDSSVTAIFWRRQATHRLQGRVQLFRVMLIWFFVVAIDVLFGLNCRCFCCSSLARLGAIDGMQLFPLSILCHSFHDIDTYTMGFPRGNGQGLTSIFRVVKHCLPGPYTFILPASKELPKQCIRYGTSTAKYASRKKNVGVRMPADVICQAILEKMGSPLISTSVKWPKEDDWMIDPVVIADVYGPEGLEFVVDGGVRVADPSTVVDMTHHPPTIIRQGKGPKLDWMVAKDDKDSAELQVSSAQIF
ncbi:hypothetical protein Syun_020248 [Stephania yunnanensis]|uniref:Threonylcarbamoyl-AMP synthase n=1 Tax=Stephania yunnanensis TaxID=152371 RepID=A0AAP0IDK4_9MAGN